MDLFIEWAYQMNRDSFEILDAIATGRYCADCGAVSGERCIDWDRQRHVNPHQARW